MISVNLTASGNRFTLVTNTAIHFANVSCTIGKKKILDGISFDISLGDISGILGPNGAGKSSLISLMTGLRKHSAGEIVILGEKLPLGGSKLRRRIGVVLQETALYEELTAFENLRFSASLYDVPEPKQRITEVLELLMLQDRARQIVSTLSGGLRRRIAIARALLHKPELLIIDEPTLGVDVEARHAIWSHLRLLRSRGTTIIVATNYLDEVQALCDSVVVLRAGKLLTFESPEALLSRAGNCIDVECQDEGRDSIIEAVRDFSGVLGVSHMPGGLTVFIGRETISKDVMKLIMQTQQIEGFRVRAPDLAEVFKSLEPEA
jgi:ABC-2 type transport system ATP-binding protein